MELRWLKGNWSFGSYKLQFRNRVSLSQGGSVLEEWQDVPIAIHTNKPSLTDIFKEEIDRAQILDLEFVGRLAQIAENHILGGGKV